MHVILDDAFHYLQERGLTGNHCTTVLKKTNGLSISNGTHNTNGSSHTNGNSNSNGNGHTNGHTNGHVQSNGATKTNGDSNGTAQATNGGSNGNGNTVAQKNGHHQESTSKLLVWSAADEKALKRVIEGYQSFYKEQVLPAPTKLDDLAYTLATRRSHMLWRAFAIVPSGSQTQESSLPVVKPIRSSTEAGIAFVFTGQGAQYAKMGADLLEYPLFETTLRRIDEIYTILGCTWSIFGTLRAIGSRYKPVTANNSRQMNSTTRRILIAPNTASPFQRPFRLG